jgi:hypothetical protein
MGPKNLPVVSYVLRHLSPTKLRLYPRSASILRPRAPSAFGMIIEKKMVARDRYCLPPPFPNLRLSPPILRETSMHLRPVQIGAAHPALFAGTSGQRASRAAARRNNIVPAY